VLASFTHFHTFQVIADDSAVITADDGTVYDAIVSDVAARVFSKGFCLQQLLEFVRSKGEWLASCHVLMSHSYSCVCRARGCQICHRWEVISRV